MGVAAVIFYGLSERKAVDYFGLPVSQGLKSENVTIKEKYNYMVAEPLSPATASLDHMWFLTMS